VSQNVYIRYRYTMVHAMLRIYVCTTIATVVLYLGLHPVVGRAKAGVDRGITAHVSE